MAKPDDSANTNISGSNCWNFKLALLNLDQLLMGKVALHEVAVAAEAFGAFARIDTEDYARDSRPAPPLPGGWPADSVTAWNAWIAQIPDAPDGWGVFEYYGFLLKASIIAGDIAAPEHFEDWEYMVVGWVTYFRLADEEELTYQWVGKDEWILGGQFAVSGAVARECYVPPRNRRHQSEELGWSTSSDPQTPTMVKVTLGNLSGSAAWSTEPNERGQVGSSVSFSLWPSISYHSVNDVQVGTSYGEVQDVTGTDELVAVNCHGSFYSTSSAPRPLFDDWKAASGIAPEGAQWRAFSNGNTLCLHKLRPSKAVSSTGVARDALSASLPRRDW